MSGKALAAGPLALPAASALPLTRGVKLSAIGLMPRRCEGLAKVLELRIKVAALRIVMRSIRAGIAVAPTMLNGTIFPILPTRLISICHSLPTTVKVV